MPGPVVVAGLAWTPTAEGLAQLRGWMPGDPDLIQPDCPNAIQVLADQDPPSGIAPSIRSRRDIDEEAAEPDGVIIGDGGLVGEADLMVALGGRDFAEHRAGLVRVLGEAPIVAVDVSRIEPLVSLIDVGDPFQGQLGDQAVLERSALTFDPALGLGGVGGDGLDGD